ncbi:hypothetical protein CPT_Sycamore_037 [Streptomyces phage Sycamore]|uniref:Uncharacterized protein n=1 Tax=Streptomyces phage Sycamore TaxID=2767589 RepID=A0A873WDN8_9CAUD|nr:hypothetical protein CPT_Sycamore_037 [Streptomyces phage Sycamore]
MNGRKYIPGLDGYDNGEQPTLSVHDEWDREELTALFDICDEFDSMGDTDND